jgi:hypothetical protein
VSSDVAHASTLDPATLRRNDVRMEPFHEGQKIWVEQSDGSQRAAIFVGEAELASWFGGGPGVYVVYPDTRSGEEVSAARVVPRDE